MLESILSEAAESAGFEMVRQDEIYTFFKRGDSSERYLIFASLQQLRDVEEIHSEVLERTPDEMRRHPAFSKNCDLILLHKVERLSEYEALEQHILSYEEDPFHFKKYFLYFDQAEAELAKGKTFVDIEAAISDQAQFTNYKYNRLIPSLYGLAARIFIKVPFLHLPRSEKELVPLSVEITEALFLAGALDTWQQLPVDLDSIDDFIQVIVNEELENIKNSDSGI